MSRLQTFLASNVGFFQPQRATAQPAAPTRPLEGFLQQHASFFGAAKPQAATYPMDARGNFHAEDPQTRPYQPIPVPEGGAVRGVDGGWVVLDKERAQQALAYEQDQAQRVALPQSSVPFVQSVRGQLAAGLLDTAGMVQRAGLTTEEPTLLSPGGNADDLHRMASVARGTATQQADRSWMPTTARVTSQAVGTLAKVVPIALTTGPAGVIAEAALTRTSQAVQEGRDANLKGWDLARYSAKAGTIEGGTTALFGKLNKFLPGIGGLENIGSKTVQETAKQTLMRLGVGAVGELAEEEAITVLDALNQTAEGVDHNAVKNLGETMKETAWVTLATMGLANTPKLVSLAPGPWAQRNPEAAAKLAAIENPSRKDLADAGISGARNTTPQERAEVAKSVKAAMAAVEPAEDSDEPPSVNPGFVRMYHGGDEYDGGPRWLTPDPAYAEGYATKDGRQGAAVYYVDIPEDDPRLVKAYDDSGTGQKAPYLSFNADEDIASQLRPYKEQSLPVAQVAPEETAVEQPTEQPLETQAEVPSFEPAAVAPAKAEEPFQIGRLIHWTDDKGKERLGRIEKMGPGYLSVSNEGGELVPYAVDTKTIRPYYADDTFEPGEKVGTQFTSGPDQEGTVIGRRDDGAYDIETATGRHVVSRPWDLRRLEGVAKPEKRPDAPQNEQSPTTEAVSPELRNHYKEMTGRELGGIVKPKREHIPAIQFFNARKTKVQFFKSPDGSTANSFYDPKTRTVFLNSEKTGDPLWYLVGHEYAHASGADQRLADLPPEVLDEAKRNYAAGAAPAYLKKLQANPRLWEREAVARYVGEVLADPEQRARIRNENPTLWQKIVEAVKRFIGADKVPPSIRKVLDELNTLPPGETPLPVNAAATPQTPQATTTTTANPNDRYANYTGFANPARGTVAGDMQQATAEGMGPTKRDARPRAQRIQDAAAEYSLDPQAERAELDEAIRSDQPLSDRQSDLLNIVRAEAAQKALTSKATDDLAEVARLNRAYLEKGSDAGKALQARSEAQWQTAEGRAVILVEELTGLTASELDALEKAKADLRRLGGDTGPMLSDSGPMLADVIDKETARRTDEEKEDVKNALKDTRVARAASNVIKIERAIAKRHQEFRTQMENLGVLPRTPQLMSQVLADADATRYVVSQMRAYRSLERGYGVAIPKLGTIPGFQATIPARVIPFRKKPININVSPTNIGGFKIGALGAIDAAFEGSLSNLISAPKSIVVNGLSPWLNMVVNLTPRAIAGAGNAALSAVSGGRLGQTGTQLGELKYLAKAFFNTETWSQAWANAKLSAWNEASQFAQQYAGEKVDTPYTGNKAIPGKLGYVIRTPGFGSNTFFDDLAQTAIGRMEAYARAYRESIETGVSDAAREQYIQDLVDDPKSIAWQDPDTGGVARARRMTLQEEGGAVRQKVFRAMSGVRRDIPIMRWFFKFLKIPVNATYQGSVEWTPVGFFTVMGKVAENARLRRIGVDRDLFHGVGEQAARSTLATLAAIAFASFVSVDDDELEEGAIGITGNNHPNMEKRNTIRYTMSDGQVVRKKYDRFDPVSTAVSNIVDLIAAFQRHGNAPDAEKKVTTAAVAAVGNSIINRSTGRGLQQLAMLLKDMQYATEKGDPELFQNSVQRFVEQQRMSFVPRLLTSAEEAAADSHVELMNLKNIEGVSSFDVWGNPKSLKVFGDPTGDWLYRWIVPVDTVTTKLHPGDRLVGNWNAQQTDAKKRFKAPELAAEYTRDGETFRMKPEQYQRYAELSGQIAAKLYDAGNFDAENPTQQQINALERNFADARNMAKDLLHKEWNGGPKATVDAATVAASIRQAQVRRLQETARSKATLKVLPGEDVNRAKKRIADWKVNRDEAVAELRRLKVLN
jgi:hypothetical protein